MKQLFWKEWYELRWLPLVSGVGTAALIFGMVAWARTIAHNQFYEARDTFVFLLSAWHLMALVAGAGLFSPEIGRGGLLFLSALPVSRRCLWWVKVTTALGMLLVSLAAGAFACVLTDLLLFGTPQTLFFLHEQAASSGKDAIFLISVGGFFAAALAVSLFLDRTLSTVAATLLVSLMGLIVLGNFIDAYLRRHFGGPMLLWPTHLSSYLAVGTMSIFVAVSISYWTFTQGEMLRSAKRFRVGTLVGVVSLSVAVLIFGIGSRMLLW